MGSSAITSRVRVKGRVGWTLSHVNVKGGGLADISHIPVNGRLADIRLIVMLMLRKGVF